MKQKVKIVISWILVLLWCLLIFFFSSMNGTESQNKSKDIISKTIEKTTSVGSDMGVLDKKPAEKTVQKITQKLNKPLRKTMHFLEYFILSILLMNALILSKCKFIYAILLSIIFSFSYACTDEFHQSFMKDRTPTWKDVVIDTGGAMAGTGIYSLIYCIKKRKK